MLMPAIDFRNVAADFGLTAPNFYGGERTRRHILEIEFKNGAVYRYTNVAPSVYRNLMAAESSTVKPAERSN